MRMRTVTAAVVLAAATTLALAAPAAADHVVGVERTGCHAGALAGNFPGDVSTTKVSVRTSADGFVRATCTFRLPQEQYNDEFGFLWQRPRATTVSEVTACVIADPRDPAAEMYGTGTMKVTAGGVAKVDCLFDLRTV